MSPTGCTPHRHTVIVPPKDHSNTSQQTKEASFPISERTKEKAKEKHRCALFYCVLSFVSVGGIHRSILVLAELLLFP